VASSALEALTFHQISWPPATHDDSAERRRSGLRNPFQAA
jgi:hypothetical protein